MNEEFGSYTKLLIEIGFLTTTVYKDKTINYKITKKGEKWVKKNMSIEEQNKIIIEILENVLNKIEG